MALQSTRQHHHIIVAVENFFLPTPVFDLPRPHTYDLREYQQTHPDELVKRIRDAEIVIINRIPLGQDVLAQEVTPNLRMICVVASGTDSVDKEACQRRGIVVTNTPHCNTSAVAGHAIGLYFSVRRKIPYTHQLTQISEWPNWGLKMNAVLDGPDGKPPRTCSGEVAGIVGYGAVGKKIGKLAEALGMRVMVSSRKGKSPLGNRVSFNEVMRTASVVFLCMPRTPETTNMISTHELSQMQTDAILVNVSRGGTVDEEALVEALEARQITGAATDVYLQEPVDEQSSPLIGSRVQHLNLVTTPHCAWCSEESNINTSNTLAGNVSAWILGKPINVVS